MFGLSRKANYLLLLQRKLPIQECSGFFRPLAACAQNHRTMGLKTHEDHLEIFDSESESSQFPYYWLRDHCRCSLCYNATTHQRNVDAFCISFSIHPTKCDVVDGNLQLEWPDGHVSKYLLSWLQQQSYSAYRRNSTSEQRSLWRKPPQDIAHVPLNSFLHSDDGLRQLMQSLIQFGVGFVEGAEATVAATEEVINRVGPPKRTLFGDVWEMKPSEYHEDTAYSTQALGAHTDNTYFTEASGLQVFHILRHDGDGGETLLVDGFRAAQDIKSRDEESHRILSSVSIPSEYLEPGQHHLLTAPVLRLHPVTGELQQIRYNLYDRASMNTVPFERVMEWYRALRALTQAVTDPAGECWLRLRPGQILFIDNWRVLHGRSAYTGLRWVSGAYISRTDYLSRARVCGALHADI